MKACVDLDDLVAHFRHKTINQGAYGVLIEGKILSMYEISVLPTSHLMEHGDEVNRSGFR
jgi:hypothetical protein